MKIENIALSWEFILELGNLSVYTYAPPVQWLYLVYIRSVNTLKAHST